MTESDDVVAIREAMSDVLAPEGVERWLDTPSRRWHNRTPRQMAQTGESFAVLTYIETLKDGSFS